METIKIDGETIRVDELPSNLQNLVVLYEKITEKEVGVRIELGTQEAAKIEVTRRIVAGYREVKVNVPEGVSTTEPADLTPSELAEDASDETAPTE